MPDDTSVTIDITLPRDGNIIVDKPPMLVSKTSSGAHYYEGVFVGMDVPENVEYTVTVPDAAGNFTITLPKSAWEQSLRFFETIVSKFVEEPMEPGDPVPSDFIVINPDAPRNIKALSATTE